MMSGADASRANPRNTILRVLWVTIAKYSAIDGAQTAASFAYYAFFALFPLIILLVAIASFFNPAQVGRVVFNAVSHYVVVDSGKHDVVRETIRSAVKSRRGVGFFAILGLIWSSMRFFQSLVIGVNRAWGTREYSWWRLPLQNILLIGVLASGLSIGVLTPLTLNYFETVIVGLRYSYGTEYLLFGFELVRLLLPTAILFYGLSVFYKLAPRRHTTFRDIWGAALMVTLLLQTLQYLFILYARNVARFSSVYGAFGGVIAVLIWIYLSGTVIILGGCFSAARAEVAGKLKPETEPVVVP